MIIPIRCGSWRHNHSSYFRRMNAQSDEKNSGGDPDLSFRCTFMDYGIFRRSMGGDTCTTPWGSNWDQGQPLFDHKSLRRSFRCVFRRTNNENCY